MRKPALMIQGTGSNVGKTLIVAGLARAFARRGMAVRPFKPQNMSNNAGATPDGGEIGRAQILQARAAGIAPSIHMNPVLLKPESESGAQVIVQGKRRGTMSAREYTARKAEFLAPVLESFGRLEKEADIVLVEGAGSPAEINLRAGDIANMGFAEAADIPVILVGVIDRGGVIASLVGTHTVLEPTERARIRGFLINRFRGDPALFSDGAKEISRRTGWADRGILPHFPDAAHLPAEDTLALQDVDRTGVQSEKGISIVVPRLGRIANFDDLDPLRQEPQVTIDLVEPGRALPGDADIILLPGSKSTIADLQRLRAQGWDIDIAAHHRRGGKVFGICGGYQMLGKAIHDPDGIEGTTQTITGLGLLNVETTLTGAKSTRPVEAVHRATGSAFSGYEIHLGATTGGDCAHPFAIVDGIPDGAVSADDRIAGTYIHGLFADDRFRAAFLAQLGANSELAYDARIESTLDELADHLETHLDLSAFIDLANSRTG